VRAAVLNEGALEITDLPDPSPGPGDVVLRVDACGICGSDLHAIRMFASPGTVMGHEFAGEVVATGEGVGDDVRGRRVTARPLASCGDCPACHSGRSDRCTAFGLIGHERPGAWAEYVAVPARELYVAPTQTEGAIVEPLAVARRAVRRAGDISEDSVLILGGGPVGLAVTAWARALGAGHIVVSEPDESRRQLAEQLGATAVDPGPVGPAAAFADIAGRQPTVVFECVGQPGLIHDAMSLAGFEARVIVVGVCPMPDQILPWTGLSKELDLRFAIYYGPEDFTDTIAALDQHQLEVDAFVTDEIGLDELPARFAAMVEHATGGKVLVRP
jgi:(R,R)-butanediol dehydrogenase/meso-butanediol dehydrogenase/diacetyl reductase